MTIENHLGEVLVGPFQSDVPEILVSTETNDVRGRWDGRTVAPDEKVSELLADIDLDDMWRRVDSYNGPRVTHKVCQDSLLNGSKILETAHYFSYDER